MPNLRFVLGRLGGFGGTGGACDRPSYPSVTTLPLRRTLASAQSVLGVFPRNRRGGVLFRFYTRSPPTFVSFCCKPSAISPSAARIARARRGDSICAVGPPNGVGWEIQKFAFNTTHQQHRGTAHLLGLCHLDVFALFRGFRQRSKRTFGRSRRDLPIHAVGPPIGVDHKIGPRICPAIGW